MFSQWARRRLEKTFPLPLRAPVQSFESTTVAPSRSAEASDGSGAPSHLCRRDNAHIMRNRCDYVELSSAGRGRWIGATKPFAVNFGGAGEKPRIYHIGCRFSGSRARRATTALVEHRRRFRCATYHARSEARSLARYRRDARRSPPRRRPCLLGRARHTLAYPKGLSRLLASDAPFRCLRRTAAHRVRPARPSSGRRRCRQVSRQRTGSGAITLVGPGDQYVRFESTVQVQVPPAAPQSDGDTYDVVLVQDPTSGNYCWVMDESRFAFKPIGDTMSGAPGTITQRDGKSDLFVVTGYPVNTGYCRRSGEIDERGVRPRLR